MTRFPKSGKGKKWTALELKAIPADWKGDTLSDGDGLSGEVRLAKDQTASVRFKYAFKWERKVTWFQCGTWPTTGMDSIRGKRDEARRLAKAGINPNDNKRADRIEGQAKVKATIANAALQNTQDLRFSEMFETWLADGVVRKDGNAEIRRSFQKDVIPAIGMMPVALISEHHLRGLLRRVVQRGSNRMAVCLHTDLVQLFGWAEKRKPWRALMIEGNPINLVEIEKTVSPDYNISDERTRTLIPHELVELKNIFVNMESQYKEASVGSKYGVARPIKKESQLAVWICLSTLCRIGELLMSEWTEIDLQRGVWDIPVEKVKGARGRKHAQRVSLSDFSLRQFKALHELTGHTPFCFPARESNGHVCVKSVTKQIGDRQSQFKSRTRLLAHRRNDNSLVLDSGKNGEWVPHDMRRTGATMMQALKIPLDVIDRCQNHVMKGSQTRRSYFHHDYLDEKREAWGLLGARLDEILRTSDA